MGWTGRFKVSFIYSMPQCSSLGFSTWIAWASSKHSVLRVWDFFHGSWLPERRKQMFPILIRIGLRGSRTSLCCFLFVSQNKSQAWLDSREEEMVCTSWGVKWHAYTGRKDIGGGYLWRLSYCPSWVISDAIHELSLNSKSLKSALV